MIRLLLLLAIAFLISDIGTAQAACNYYLSDSTRKDGWAVPYDVTDATHELIVDVTSCSDTQFTVQVGSTSSQYVYRNLYYWNGSAWTAVSLTSTTGGSLVGNDWYVGPATATINIPAGLTRVHVAAHVCTRVSDTWKCGCADATCATPQWSLQAAIKQEPAGTACANGVTLTRQWTPPALSNPTVINVPVSPAGGSREYRGQSMTTDYIYNLPENFSSLLIISGGRRVRVQGTGKAITSCSVNVAGYDYLMHFAHVGEYVELRDIVFLCGDMAETDAIVTGNYPTAYWSSGDEFDMYIFNSRIEIGTGSADGIHADLMQTQESADSGDGLKDLYIEHVDAATRYSGYTSYRAERLFARNSVVEGLPPADGSGYCCGYQTRAVNGRFDENVFAVGDNVYSWKHPMRTNVDNGSWNASTDYFQHRTRSTDNIIKRGTPPKMSCYK